MKPCLKENKETKKKKKEEEELEKEEEEEKGGGRERQTKTHSGAVFLICVSALLSREESQWS